jgi:hypothetical protein
MAAPSSGISIDISKDLESLSDLKTLISANSSAILQLESTFAQYAGGPISAAVGNFTVNLALTDSPNWTTASGIAFSLSADAKCNISIANKGEAFSVALIVDSSATTDVQLTPADGMTYVNIDLDFDIKGNVSGSGNVSGVGIAGKASGSATTTLSFCQPVPSGTETVAALQMAFSQLVFPTAPDSVTRMAAGSSCRMNFDGTLNCELDVSYGLGSYKLAAPSAALVQQSVEKAWQKLTLPTATVKAGVTGSVKYTHSNQFGLVVEKKDANTALLYLVRSASDEWDEAANITVGITTTGLSVALDPTQVSSAVQSVTGSAPLAGLVASAVSTPVNNLETSATAKLNKWIADVNGNVGLNIGLSQQKNRTALFNFTVDLTQADLAKQSWTALLNGDVAEAMSIGGFALMAGSGLAEQLKRSSTITFQFFNLFSWTGEQDFFDNSTVQLGADGTIRIQSDIGIESSTATKQALDKMSFHFTATATDDTNGDVSKAEIDLNIEISEKGDPQGAAVLAKVLGTIDAASLQSTIDAMGSYAQQNAAGTLALTAVLKPSGYSRLAFSPYVGNKPPVDQANDQANWNAIHDATVKLMGLSFVEPCNYADWGAYNSMCNTGSTGAVPDRRNTGNWGAVPDSFFGNFQSQAQFIGYFFRASAGGMNLFDDLVTLAHDTAAATTIDQWDQILTRLVSIVKGDANIDYAKPIAAAVLSLAASAGGNVSVSTVEAKDASSLTAMLTIA